LVVRKALRWTPASVEAINEAFEKAKRLLPTLRRAGT
jgi:hypothetical protein